MSAQISYKKQIAFFLILSALLLFAVEIGVRIIETPYEPCTFIGKDALKNVEEIKQNQICDDNNSTCLLYTSPSPRDRQKSRMPSSA